MTSRQSWNAESYERNAGFVADLGAPVLDLLAPRAGERILDLGCGHGKLTVKIGQAGAQVLAVDASPEQIAASRLLGLDAHVMDGEKLSFGEQFDAVFSNAALHWMKNADAVIDGVFNALRPGGRFVGEMGGAGNVKRVSDSLVACLARRGIDAGPLWPWYFPSPEDYTGKLAKAGFRVDQIELIERPTDIPGDIEGWLETFGESFLGAVTPVDRRQLIAEVRNDLAPALQDEAGNWTVDYVRLRFRAFKPDAPG